MLLIKSFLKALALIFNWKIAILILLYAFLLVSFTFLLGLVGIVAENKGKEKLWFGMGCLWQILGPVWQALLLALCIGAATPIILGTGQWPDLNYAFSNLTSLWLAALAGVVLVLILSIIPIVNFIVGEQGAGTFWIAIPVITTNFVHTGFWKSLGTAYVFFWDNILVMIGFALASFIVITASRFLTMGILAILMIIPRFKMDTDSNGAIFLPLTIFIANIFEFVPIFAFMYYFTEKYGKVVKQVDLMGGGWFSGILDLIFITAIAGIIVYGIYRLIRFISIKLIRSNIVEVSTKNPSYEEARKCIEIFKALCMTYIIIFLLGIVAVIVITALGGGLSNLLYNFFIFPSVICWIAILVNLYKVSKFLKLRNILAVRPSLIVLFVIISGNVAPLPAFIALLIIWLKSNVYLKYELKNN